MTARTTRRQLFGAPAALLLLAAPAAGAAKAAELDGDLLAACARFHEAFRQTMTADADAASTDADYLDIDEAWEVAFDEVLALRPRTPEGVQARAHVAFLALRWKVAPGVDEPWTAQADAYERLAIECLADVAGSAAA